jgi:voltage-gated potassium channel Kch
VSPSNSPAMSQLTPDRQKPALIERRIRKVAHARSITLALATTFIALAVGGAVAIRFLDEDSFPSFGLAFWWALQTVTTVGYGDVVPSGGTGKVIGSIEMVLGVSFVSFLTAGVTSAVVQRVQDRRHEEDVAQREGDVERLEQSLAEIRAAIASLESRLS